MNLLDTYANDCGVKIKSKPSYPDVYFPKPERYITLHAGSGMDSKNYDLFSEVTWMVEKYLKKEGIRIVQIGTDDEKPVNNCMIFNGVTNVRQSAHLVKNALAHIGNDSFWMHYAGANDIPYIGLYGPTLADVCKPSFGRGVSIESHRGGKRASHKDVESPKTINFINPEEVVSEILEVLDLSDIKEETYETLYVGEDYSKTIIEVLPDHILPPNVFSGQVLNIRMDYHFDEILLAQNLRSYEGVVITDKPITEETLKSISRRIKLLTYLFDEKTLSKAFIKELHNSGVNYQLLFQGSMEDLPSIRSELFSYNPVFVKPSGKKPDVNENISFNGDSYFKTNKFLLSKNQIYLSLSHLKKGLSVQNESENFQKLGDFFEDDSFWNESSHYYLLNKNNTI